MQPHHKPSSLQLVVCGFARVIQIAMNSFTESHHLHKLARYVTETPYTMLEGGTAVSNVLREKHVLLSRTYGIATTSIPESQCFVISQLPTSPDRTTRLLIGS
jgi:hypothetical protein